ncbi:4Fe-4S dicluster domain-containing protein [Adlercreutzia sp. R21]|uniref:4Fe-4S dicluster domain-containing protein n=1 Tax=Adlercreutzia wanghongyangiae TaxID=3111451 RepID=A0ABU6IIK9_9ACTN|nr:4Fe-4S dicluster domain-containing protein [Adlercreutzia sp. R21]MEC4176280.1 4Fe-4S dicluster domain-containing protein [Adlercreutzia sp. R7]MEC4184362.1 4Fe-4S dicluster domain-containing protein [Adlercreutzia sp. R21]
MTRFGYVIDMKGCIACNACSVACKVENNLPDGIWYNRVVTEGKENLDTPSGVYPAIGEKPALTMDNVATACQHCEKPACVEVCPVGATFKDPDTGAVRQDCDTCIGCQSCMMACPYTGVRSYNEGEPKYAIDFAMGDAAAPVHQSNTVEKCTMCWHRLERGEQPACVEVCPARVRYFGDFDDPESEVSKLIVSREYKQLLPEEGTTPSVYYLV